MRCNLAPGCIAADLSVRGGSPVQVVMQLRGSRGSLPPWCQTSVQARFVQPAQPSCVFFRQSDRLAGAVGHGQRYCGRVHGVKVQAQDPADGLLGVAVLLAQLGVVGLSAQHVLVGLLVVIR